MNFDDAHFEAVAGAAENCLPLLQSVFQFAGERSDLGTLRVITVMQIMLASIIANMPEDEDNVKLDAMIDYVDEVLGDMETMHVHFNPN